MAACAYESGRYSTLRSPGPSHVPELASNRHPKKVQAYTGAGKMTMAPTRQSPQSSRRKSIKKSSFDFRPTGWHLSGVTVAVVDTMTTAAP